MRRAGRGVASVAALAVLAGCSPSAPLRAPTPIDPAPFAAVLADAPASVARLLSTSCAGAPISGSGFLVAPDLVLTAAHVVDGARQVSVRLTGAPPTPAQVVGIDPARDTALVRLPVAANAPALRFGTPTTGTPVAAIGLPLGDARPRGALASITSVSDAAVVNGHGQTDLVALDASLAPGVSGGPALAADGTVRGMVVGAIRGRGGRDSAETIALAIPPASLAAALGRWRDDPATAAAPCAGEPAAPPAPPPALSSTAGPEAAEITHTLWLLGQGVNAGQAQAAWGQLSADRRLGEGDAGQWAAARAGVHWDALAVRSVQLRDGWADARVRLRTTSPGACHEQELDVGLQLVAGTWLVGLEEPLGAARRCG